MKNVLILEDERHSADRLVRQLSHIAPTMQVEGPIETVREAVEWLSAHHADLILADIRLADGLSFDALKHAPADSAVVFTTAYDEYALRAFKSNSVDYLLKPIDADELEAAIDKARERVTANSIRTLQSLLDTLRSPAGRYRQRFLIPCFDGYKTVPVSEVNHFTTENKTTRVYLHDGRAETLSMSLDELESQLDPARFFRANRQYIVSADNIGRISSFFSSKLKITPRNFPETVIIVSKEKVPRFKAWLDS